MSGILKRSTTVEEIDKFNSLPADQMSLLNGRHDSSTNISDFSSLPDSTSEGSPLRAFGDAKVLINKIFTQLLHVAEDISVYLQGGK